MPEGLWIKCSACDAVLYRAELERNLNVCPKCSHHMRIGGRERLAQGIAVSYNCDLIVAVVVGKVADDAVAKAAHRFLETNTVQVWINALLEGK